MDARLRDLFERRAGSLGTGFMLLLLAGLWFLLFVGEDLEALDDCRWSAMMRAVASGHVVIVERLLDAGAPILHGATRQARPRKISPSDGWIRRAEPCSGVPCSATGMGSFVLVSNNEGRGCPAA